MGIKQPPAYEHPNKRKRREITLEPPTAERVKTSEIPIKKKNKRVAQQPPQLFATTKTDEGEKVVLRLVAYPPAKGQFDLFDQMVASGISERSAVLALLRRSSANLEQIVQSWSDNLDTTRYERSGQAIETNRSIRVELLEQLKATIDPFGVMTGRAFGTTVGKALLVKAMKGAQYDERQ